MSPESREVQNRDNTERPKQWKPPSSLPDPLPRDGWKHRWVRTSILGQADPRNVATRHQDGFEPCKWEDYPEVARAMLASGTQTGNIEIGGLMLCRAPVEMVDQRNGFYLKQANDWMQSVDSNFMRENDPRMPLFNEKRSEVRFGKR
jgi:hypothetical protein